MIMRYANFTYFLCLFILIGILVGLYFLLRNKSTRTQKIVILCLIIFNLLQHIFKKYFWYHIDYTGFSLQNSASNMCAFLIMAAPIIFFCKSSVWKDFFTYNGTFGGIIAILVPYWFIGQSIFTIEYLRFFTCHGLLFITALLPTLLGIHKISFKNFWKVAFIFNLALMFVIFNDMIYIVVNSHGMPTNMYETLCSLNPTWSMRPNEKFGFLVRIIDFFSPDIFMNVETNTYIPILWYFIPIYLLITTLAFIVTIIFDREGFNNFISKFKRKKEVVE